MAQRVIQASFTFGELDPRLFARADFTGYFKGVKRGRNVVAVAQGALVKRFGTRFRALLRDETANENITNLDHVRLFCMYRVNAGPYFIVFRKNNGTETAFNIYDTDATLVATVSAGTTYTLQQLTEVNFVAFADRIFILHHDVKPHVLLNADPAVPGTWTFNPVTFTHVPTFDFSFYDGTSYSGATVTFTPSATTGAVTITCANATPFTSNHIGGVFIGGGGILRITGVTSTTVANGYTIEDFVNTSAIRGDLVLLSELAWSDANAVAPAGKKRGWPSVGRVVQDRLVLGNTPTLGHITWLSAQNEYINFNDSEADANDAFSMAIPNNDQVQSYTDKNALIVLGSRGVYSTIPIAGEPITPSNAYFAREDSAGAANVPAQVLDDQVFYVDAQGKQINLMANKADVLSGSGFDVANASIFSPTLIRNPVSMAKFKSATNNGQLLLVSNEDGTLATLQSEARQDVAAWTLSDTRGAFGELAGLDHQCMCLVERYINSGTTANGNPLAIKAYEDFAILVDFDSTASTTLFENDSDYLVLGSSVPFSKITITLTTPASQSVQPTFEYLDTNNQWIVLTATDGTLGLTSTGDITWSITSLSDWQLQKLNDESAFWIRIKRTTDVLATSPIASTIKINTASVITLEELSFDTYMDATTAKTSSGAGVITGLTSLSGQSVFVQVNGSPQGPYIVSSAGELTIDLLSTDVEVGLLYSPEVIPMPVAVFDRFLSSEIKELYKPRLIKSVFIDYYESLGIYIDDVQTADFNLYNLVAGQVVEPQTGVKEISPRTGWEPRAEILITQKSPLPFTLLGIGMVVEVG